MSGIRIITEPSIFVVGRQVVDEGELARFLDAEGASGWGTDAPGAAEKLCEVGGRVCYASWKNPRPGGNRSYLSHIVEAGHGRVTEHAVWTFLITGISRSLSHELYTHTVGMSKSMLSQRYVDEGDCAFVVPPGLMAEVGVARRLIVRFGGPPDPRPCDVLDWGNRHLGIEGIHQLTVEEGAGLRWLASADKAQRDYLYLSDYLSTTLGHIEERTARRKAAREAARSILPNCVETKICVTANARSLRNFFEQRGSAGADAEIRRLAVAWLAIMQRGAPNLFGDYAVSPDGTISTPNRKV
jgi:thymidylate synthase (FAD)